MVSIDYMEKGLLGMSRADQASAMTGHLGAALVAGFFFSEQHRELDGAVHLGFAKEMDRILEGEESVFGPREKASITVSELFEPYPEEKPQEDQIERIVHALSGNIEKTRSSGHNTIFAALAIRALVEHPEYATPSIIEGICKLIHCFDNHSAGSGYYGKELGRIDGDKVSLPEDDNFPLYSDLRAMVESVLDALIQRGAERRQGFGGLWHVINHAASLVDLAEHGNEELAQKGLGAHHQHMRLWRTVPNVEDELGAEERAEQDPLTSDYWESGTLTSDPDRAQLTHRVKTLYGFYRLTHLVDDTEKLKEAEDKLRYLM
jgi:hypothetical protein